MGVMPKKGEHQLYYAAVVQLAAHPIRNRPHV
jgi:hypothetical protein